MTHTATGGPGNGKTDGAPDPTAPAVDLTEVTRRHSQLKAAMAALGTALEQLTPDIAERAIVNLQAASAGISAALAHHVEVHEGPESFHREVLNSQPHLAARVGWLQGDHERLKRQAEALSDLVARTHEASAAAVKAHGERLLHDLTRHRRRGAELVWDAFEFDLGGGD